MQCPTCKLEMFITNSRYITENDNTADEVTKLYYEQDLSCRNAKCSNNGKIVKTVRTEIQLSNQ